MQKHFLLGDGDCKSKENDKHWCYIIGDLSNCKDKKISNENGIIPDDILSSNQLYYSEEACRNKVKDTMVMIGNEDFIPGQEILGKVAQMIWLAVAY